MVKKFELFPSEEPISPHVLKKYFDLFKRLTAFLLTFLFVLTPIAPALAQVNDITIDQPVVDTPASTTEPESTLPDIVEDIVNPDNAITDPLPSEPEPEAMDPTPTPDTPAPVVQPADLSEDLPSEAPATESVDSINTTQSSEEKEPQSQQQMLLTGGSQMNPDLDLNSGKNGSGARLPQVEDSTGALIYSHPILTPPGRNGMGPNLALTYHSQKGSENSIFGYGWDISGIPYIERVNKNGTDILYRSMDISSSMSGELVASTTATSSIIFIPRTGTGDFISYTYSSSTATFLAIDKQGTTYTYGTSTNFRLDDPEDSSHIFRWMISEIRDKNGNYMEFEYYKNGGQIYPLTITYTGNGVTDGIFTVNFNREDSNYDIKSYKTGFLSTTAYRIKNIVNKINNATSSVYSLAYTTGQNGQRQMLASITESGVSEAGATVTLPSTSFTYQTNALTSGDWQNTSVTPPTYVYQCSGGGSDQYAGGVLWGIGIDMGDFNGDSISDVAISYNVPGCANPKKTYLGPNFTVADQFILPVNLTSSPSDDFNSYFFNDLNGDGLDDEVGQNPYLNTGNGFVIATTTYDNDYDPDDTTNKPRIMDLNGDGLSDYFKLTDLMYRNTGSGFVLDNDGGYWPYDFPRAHYYGDLNGDGLPDVILSTHHPAGGSGTIPEEWEEDGSLDNGAGGFVSADEFIPPIVLDEYTPTWTPDDTYKYTLADINGDGLADIVGPDVYINTGDGWDEITFPYTIDSADPRHFRVMDYNADGMPDIVHDDGEMWVSQKPVPDMLKKITYPAGGFSDITYKSSYEASSTTLPYVLQVVDAITTNDNASTTISTTLSYANPDHYYATSTPLDRRFAGFGQKTQTDSAGNYTTTYFHQADSSDSSHGEYADNFWKIGKAYRTEVYDSSDNLFSKIINKWDSATSTATAVFVKLTQTVEQSYDGTASHKDKTLSYSYDDLNGDVTQKIKWGEVTGSDDGTFSDTGADKFTTSYTYATSSTSTSMSLISGASTLDQSSNKVKETKYYYDGFSSGTADKGNLTKQEMWKTGSSYLDVEKTYNAYGLVTQEKDSRDKATNYTYDSYNFYPATVTNPVSHVTQYAYDYSSGKTATTTDPNGNIFVKVYDGLDRVLEIKQPNPAATSTLETKTAFAYTDTSGAVSVHSTDYLNSATSTESYIYLDGLRRKKQERAEAEGLNYAVKDYTYNNLGLLQKESLPYFSVGSSTTTATSTAALYTNYAYDALRRLNTSVNAVGTTTMAYVNWKTTVTDPKGKTKDLYQDAYNNLIKVEEHNNDITSTTTVATELYYTSLFNDANLKAYYRLEDTNDSKNSYHLTNTNSVVFNSGKFNNAADFGTANTNKRLGVANDLGIGSGEVTLLAWVKIRTAPANNVNYNIMQVSDTGTQVFYRMAYVNDGGTYKVYACRNRENIANTFATATFTMSTDAWYLMTLTYDGVNLKIWINGDLKASTGASGNGSSGITADDFVIGAHRSGNNYVYYASAYIDDAAVFNRDLTGEEMIDLYGGETEYSYTPFTYTTLYEYNGNNNLTKITDASGNVRNFTYDGLGRRLAAQDLHGNGDGTYGTYTYTYDDNSNMTQKVDPNSQTINYAYDDVNRLLTEDYAGSGGTEVTYVYDTCTQGKGRLCTSSSTAVSIANAYNALGQLVISTSTISAIAYPTIYTHERQGNRLTITSPDNSQVKYTYNNAGQVETVQRKESTDGSYQDLVLDLDYGPHGKITYQKNANCTETTNTYDADELYRLSRKVTNSCYEEESFFMFNPPASGEESKEDTEPDSITEEPIFTIPPTSTGASSSTKESIFSTTTPVTIEEPISTTTPKIQSTTTPVSENSESPGFFSKVYAALANGLSKIIYFIAQQFTPETAFAAAVELYQTPLYEDNDLVGYWKLENTTADVGPNLTNIDSTPFNAGQFNNAADFGTANSSKRLIASNDLGIGSGEVTLLAWVKIRTAPGNNVNYNVMQVSDSGTNVFYRMAYVNDSGTYKVYAVRNRENIANTFATATFTMSTDTWYLMALTYDGTNLKIWINGDEKASSAASGNGAGGITADNFVIGAHFSGGSYVYYVSAYIDDAAVFDRDLTGTELSDLYNGNWSVGTIIQDIAYTYDQNSNITETLDSSETHSAKKTEYTYDDLNRLTSASSTLASYGGNYNYTYTYDAMGNILTRTENGTTTTYTYATSTAPYLNPHAALKIGNATSTYDNNGNLTSNGTSTYTWDYDNRMTQTVGNNATSTYAYDSAGQRVKMTVATTSSATTYYPTKNYNITGSVPTKHIFLPDGTMIATVVGIGTSTTVSYIHTDHLSGSNVITNNAGEVAELTDYYPYGNTRLDEQTSFNEQRKFTGHEYDASIGLNYMNARYQNPTTGRFISQDPAFINIGFDLSDPQSMNAYSYARNNPLFYIDPSGNIWVPWQSSGGFGNWMGHGGFLHNVYGNNVTNLTSTVRDVQQNGFTADNIMASAADAASITAKTSEVMSLGLAPVAATKITAERALRAGIAGGLSMSTTYLDAKVEGRDVSWKEYAWTGITGAGSGLISNRGWLASGMFAGGSNAAGQFMFRMDHGINPTPVAISTISNTIGLKGTPTIFKFITEQVLVWNAETAGQAMYSGVVKSQNEKTQEGGGR